MGCCCHGNTYRFRFPPKHDPLIFRRDYWLFSFSPLPFLKRSASTTGGRSWVKQVHPSAWLQVFAATPTSITNALLDGLTVRSAPNACGLAVVRVWWWWYLLGSDDCVLTAAAVLMITAFCRAPNLGDRWQGGVVGGNHTLMLQGDLPSSGVTVVLASEGRACNDSRNVGGVMGPSLEVPVALEDAGTRGVWVVCVCVCVCTCTCTCVVCALSRFFFENASRCLLVCTPCSRSRYTRTLF